VTTSTLSVLMPVYNSGRYLRATLDSILQQTFRDFELLVVDDGSTDDSGRILAEVAGRDRRISLSRHEANRGITRSMNQLFPRARGTYVTRHDADDLSEPERFARLVAFLEANPAVGVVGSRVLFIDSEGRPLDLDFFPSVYAHEAIEQEMLEGRCICQGALMMRRQCVEAVGYYDESLDATEDFDLGLRLLEVTQFSCLEARLYRYRQHSESISHQRRAIQQWQMGKALEKAVYRRFGPAPTPAQAMPAARQYLRTAVATFEPGAPEISRLSLERALALAPGLLAQAEPLRGLLALHVPNGSTEAALAFTEAIFSELLPQTPATARLRSRWLAQLHMRAAFAGFERAGANEVLAHLRQGVRHEPRWLLNRGVLSIAIRSALRQGGAK
jgi:hypothetical protein